MNGVIRQSVNYRNYRHRLANLRKGKTIPLWEKQCGKAVWKSSVEKQCGKAVWKSSVEKQCGKAVWKSSVEKGFPKL